MATLFRIEQSLVLLKLVVNLSKWFRFGGRKQESVASVQPLSFPQSRFRLIVAAMSRPVRRATCIFGVSVLGLAGFLSYAEDQPSAPMVPEIQINDSR
jgi:hypothetical protein